MAVQDNDLIKPVSGYFVAGGFEQIVNYARRQRESAGLVPRLVDLPVKIIGENNSVLRFYRACGPLAHVDQVGTDRRMRAMFFQYADRQDTSARRFFQCLWKIAGNQFVPTGGDILRK